jgi:hypothetical protein
MALRLFKNNAKSTLAAGITSGATSLTVQTGDGAKYPSPTGSQYFLCTLTNTAESVYEIVKVTARAGDVFTITRAQEGTAAAAWNSADKVELRWTAESAEKARYTDDPSTAAGQLFRGLVAGTHPDSDKEQTTVMLIHADEIVMDDGERVLDWDRLTADITVAGAGGLDTGSEVASTWYETYAIRKKVDNTRNLLLHRAKDYFLDEDGTAGEDGQHLLRDAAARTKLAQGFKVDTAGKLEFADVKIAKVGTPTGNFWLTIESDASGVPSGTVLATSDKYEVSRLSTTSALVRFPFRTPFTTVAATQYHLVLQGDFAIHASNHALWRADTSAGAYANGAKAAYDGSNWATDTDDDFVFRVYVTRNDTAVTMPSGYDQRCLIGYVFNSSGSHFKPYEQRDRSIKTLTSGTGTESWYIADFTSTTGILLDMAAFVPPRALAAVGVGFRSGSVARVTVGGLSALAGYPDAGALSTNVRGTGYRFIIAASGDDAPLEADPIHTDLQTLHVATSGGTVQAVLSRFSW